MFGELNSTEVTNPRNNGDVNTEQEMEAPSIGVNMINERGRIIHWYLVGLNGRVDIDDDNAPAPEYIPSPADDKEASNDIIFSMY